MANQAAWIKGKAMPLEIGPAEDYTPDADEVLVRNGAIAINPLDWKMQGGFMLDKFPRILGCDIAGEVVKVGSNVSIVKPGDRVVGHCISLITAEAKHGTFQKYTVVPMNRVAKLPANISYAEGSVLPLAVSTAGNGFYGPREEGRLGMRYPTAKRLPQTQVLVVYGASSSTGAVATQMAVSSGAKVIAVASEKNFAFCKDAGASEVFDYKDPQVVDKVAEAVKNSKLEFVGIFDAIALADQSFNITIPILEKLGGGNLAAVLPAPESLPTGIKAGSVFAPGGYTDPVWADFVGQALAEGTLKPLPRPKVLGKGLQYVQQGLDESKKGVSASKLVVEL